MNMKTFRDIRALAIAVFVFAGTLSIGSYIERASDAAGTAIENTEQAVDFSAFDISLGQ